MRLTVLTITVAMVSAAIAAVVTWQAIDEGEPPATSDLPGNDLEFRLLAAVDVSQLNACYRSAFTVFIPSRPSDVQKAQRSVESCEVTTTIPSTFSAGQIVNLQGEWYYVSRVDGHENKVKANP